MAAITTIVTGNQQAKRIRTATTSATAVTDWLATPSWARYAIVYIDLTVISANSLTTTFFVANPISPIDTGLGTLKLGEHAALTAMTAANSMVVQIGPGVTGIADDVTVSATVVSYASLNCVLPPLWGIKTDPGAGNSTYTVTVAWRT